MQDHSTRRVYCRYDFTRTHTIAPGEYYCVSGKVNSADKLYLVIESVKSEPSTTAIPQFRQQRTAQEDHS